MFLRWVRFIGVVHVHVNANAGLIIIVIMASILHHEAVFFAYLKTLHVHTAQVTPKTLDLAVFEATMTTTNG